MQILIYLSYDSKKMTGYVGLYNQGATCYMNSLFQSLYFTNYFRLAVYQIPTVNDEPSDSIALALQRLFFNLQFCNYAVSTTELTRSFGWNTVDAFMQRDVQEFNQPYLSENADKSTSHQYVLHGVLVHTGDTGGGHYFAFVRPTKEEKWFKFDDDRVTPATLKEVLEDNYGGEALNTHPKLRNMKRSTNAYMLVYIRESMQDEILREVTINDIPEHLVERFKREQAEIERINKQRAEQHLYTKVYLVSDKSFQMNMGQDFVQGDQEDKENQPPIVIRTVRKDITLKMFLEETVKEYNTSSDFFRFWILLNRDGQTVRLGILPTEEEQNMTLEEIRQAHHPDYPYVRLYIEGALSDPVTGFPSFPDVRTEYNLIFIKLFDHNSQRIRGIGKLYVHVDDPISSIEDEVNRMCGFSEGTPLNIYEEIDNETIEYVEKSETFSERRIENGDIFCVERELTPEQNQVLKDRYACTNAADYLISLQHRIMVTFVPRHNHADDFDLVLRTDMGYEELVFRLAEAIDCDPSHIRLMTPDFYGNPKSTVKPMENLTLWDIIQTMPPCAGDPPRLFFEVLSMSLSEFAKNKIVKLNVCYPTLSQVTFYEVIVKKNAQLIDLVNDIRDKFNIADEEEIRFFQVENHKFKGELDYNKIATDEIPIYVEAIPKEELEKGEEDFYIDVYHYQRDLARTHSIPFKFLIIKDELFKDTKQRLQHRTGLGDKDWSKVKVNIVSKFISCITDDDYKLSEHHFTKDEALGLDHYDATHQPISEKSLFIKE
ncbi:Putative Ubiquitin carboxyl-terminal hydrolase [Rhizopus microsporus]|nr:Putative Ubiquitin carboxyl-terminal hydrolase [Rhizopus microsporus]